MFSLCRLCGNYKDPLELNAEVIELEQKLSLCCGWYPSENLVQLPVKVCDTCVNELNKCWCFAQLVQNAESKLIKLLTEPKQNEPVFNGTPEYNEFIAENSVKNEPIDTDPQLNETKQLGCIIFSSIESHDEKSQPVDIESFMQHLNDEDRIVDGTVSASGVAKLHQLYPELKTFTWTDCLYKCEKCNRRFLGKLNFN